LGGKEYIKATKDDTGPLPNKKVLCGVQYGLAISTTMFLAFQHSNVMIFVSINSQVDGCKEHIKTTLDITELLNHYEIEFMTFSCPL